MLQRLASGETALLALHFATADAGWADGTDAAGRSVYLVNGHALRALPEGEATVTEVLAALHDGYLPAGVCVVSFEPMASAAWAEAVMGEAEQVLVDGPRASGKTQVMAAIWADQQAAIAGRKVAAAAIDETSLFDVARLNDHACSNRIAIRLLAVADQFKP